MAWCIDVLRQSFGGEIVVVDGGSTDGTPKIAAGLGVKVLSAPRGIAIQCNAGAIDSGGSVLFFQAADCRLHRGWYEKMMDVLESPYVVGGGFSLIIDDPNPLFRWFEFWGNFRSRYFGIALPDQGLFVRRQAFEDCGGMRENSLIPHAQLSLALKTKGEFVILGHPMTSSARKWKETGMWSTSVQHFRIFRQFCAREIPFYPDPRLTFGSGRPKDLKTSIDYMAGLDRDKLRKSTEGVTL